MPRHNHGLRAFTMDEVRGIRARYAQGESQATLAREFRVNTTTIARMVRHETYQEDSRTGLSQAHATVAGQHAADPHGYIARARVGTWPPFDMCLMDGRVLGTVSTQTTDAELAAWQKAIADEAQYTAPTVGHGVDVAKALIEKLKGEGRLDSDNQLAGKPGND